MWDLQADGHICIYGGTSTGKTVFMKYLIEKYISAGEYSRDEIYIFSTSTYQWENYTNVYTEWNQLKDVKEIVARNTNKRGLIVLDDFNDTIDTIHDKKYIELFTRGRHIGLRVMTVAHKPTSIGKDARESLLYAITGFSSNKDYISELSKYFYGNQCNKLQNLLREGKEKGDYTMLVINKRTENTFTDKAPSPRKDNMVVWSGEDTDDTGSHTGENWDSNESGNSNNLGVQNTKNCVNDNSRNMVNYNINNQMEINQMFIRNDANNKISEDNFKHKQKMRLKHEKEECHGLCMKTIKQENDIQRQVDLLNKFCSVSCVNRYNIEDYSEAFMNNYYPSVNYKKTTVKMLGNNYGLLKSYKENDYVPIASTAIGFVADRIPKKAYSWLGGVSFGV
jgi:hypothetical protein